MCLGRKTCMIMHRSLWSDNDQSSRRWFKAIEITMLEENVKSFVTSFSRERKSYFYQEAIRHT